MRFHASDITEIKSLSPVAPKTGYILPFSVKNMSHISQGYCGPWSHAAFLVKGPNDQQQIRDDRYALDFALPIGTEVIAAKDGRVLSKADNISTCYTGNQREIGLLAEVNYIVLYHSRSECTLYSHLAPGSTFVHVGETLKKGQCIAKTGLSGWIGSTPHLHFEGFYSNLQGRFSYPILFENYSGSL